MVLQTAIFVEFLVFLTNPNHHITINTMVGFKTFSEILFHGLGETRLILFREFLTSFYAFIYLLFYPETLVFSTWVWKGLDRPCLYGFGRGGDFGRDGLTCFGLFWERIVSLWAKLSSRFFISLLTVVQVRD